MRCVANAAYRTTAAGEHGLVEQGSSGTCGTLEQDNKRNYICSREQVSKMRRIAITWPSGCQPVRPVTELLRRRRAHGHGAPTPMRLCFVGDSLVWQQFYGLECQLEAAGLLRNRSIDSTYEHPGYHSQPTGITTNAEGLELRFVFTALTRELRNRRVTTGKLQGLLQGVAPPWCSMEWPLDVRTLRRFCGEKPPDALIFNLGAAHCILHVPGRPMNRSGLVIALERAAATVAEYTGETAVTQSWHASTYRTNKEIAWCADVEAAFTSRTTSFKLLDLRTLTTKPPAAVRSDGIHLCIPGVPSALMSAWMTHSGLF